MAKPNKRIKKKQSVAKPIINVQRAWDIVAEYLAKEFPMMAACYFIDERNCNERLRINTAGDKTILASTKTYADMKYGWFK